MVSSIATGLDFFRQVLELRGYRQQILAADIANASTPGFKGVDLDFRQALATASGSATASGRVTPSHAVVMLVDDTRDLTQPGGGGPAALGSAVKYQAGTAATLDGNSVDLNREKSEAAENAVQYEAAASFTSQMIRMLNTAVGGPAGVGSSGGG